MYCYSQRERTPNMFSGAFRRSLLARAPMQGYGNGMTPRDRLIEEMKKRRGKKGMLKDPAVYPLMAIGASCIESLWSY